MRYAMVLEGIVIATEISEKVPQYPPDFYGNPVTAIPCGEDVVLGMIYNEATESFEEYVPPEPQPTQLDRIEALAIAGNDIEEKTLGEVTNLGESNLIIMEAIATQYEEGIENDLNNKEVLATIYEEILAQKEVK